jgi:phosphoserine phosphatase
LSSAEEVARAVLDVCARDPSAVVAFDGDGTLWSGDVGEDFFFHVLAHVEILEPADRAARELARSHGVEPKPGIKDTLQAMYDAYRAGTFPEPEICELMAWCLAGRTRADAVAISRATHAPGVMADRLRPEIRVVLDALRDAKVETFVVSASPTLVVEVVAESFGWNRAHVVALEAKWDGDVMLPDPVRPIPYDHGKPENLRKRIGMRTLAAAFGDSGFDVALLEAAHVHVAVHPKPALVQGAPKGTLVLGG